MYRMLTFFVLAAPLQGCFVYDCEGECNGGWGPGDDVSDTATAPGGDTADDPEPVDLNPHGLYLTPGEAEQGHSFIASIRASDALDLAVVSNVEVVGDVAVSAVDARRGEVLVALSIAQDARLGPVDLWVDLIDGTSFRIDDALGIFEAGSGHDPGTSDDGSGCD